MDDKLTNILDMAAAGDGRLVFLTGAGLSAESGIPTFRGKEGYWTVDSQEYHPQDLATWAAFEQSPELVWPWYLYRRSICRQAQPNVGHRCLAQLEEAFQDRFVGVTQNVDGLHLRAGNSHDRTWQIHGTLDFMRCAAECTDRLYEMPQGLDNWQKGQGMNDLAREKLRCPKCRGLSRPHVLWFDEHYDELRYRSESSLAAVGEADLLVIIGTAGATNLPAQMAMVATRGSVPIVDVNPADNPFAMLAQQAPNGYATRKSAGQILPEIAQRLICGT